MYQLLFNIQKRIRFAGYGGSKKRTHNQTFSLSKAFTKRPNHFVPFRMHFFLFRTRKKSKFVRNSSYDGPAVLTERIFGRCQSTLTYETFAWAFICSRHARLLIQFLLVLNFVSFLFSLYFRQKLLARLMRRGTQRNLQPTNR